jgi:hypothetical protein
MKNSGSLLKWCIVVVAVFLVGSFLVRAIAKYPQLRYERNNRAHSLELDCREVKRGDDLRTTLRILERNGEPSFESLDGDVLTIRRNDVTCKVELESVTKNVLKAQPEVDPRTFDPNRQ